MFGGIGLFVCLGFFIICHLEDLLLNLKFVAKQTASKSKGSSVQKRDLMDLRKSWKL